jgi:tetratricopeptide (TPR) repeat protein
MEILDRETDFKSDEIDDRQQQSPDASSRSSELFCQGEELFGSGQYHQAIHVWTRILFIDRGNSEAKLRIDKAKEAIAERQRILDAEIAEAKDLFDAGEIEGARACVRSVLELDGGHGEASALAAAIELLDRRSEPRPNPTRPTEGVGAVAVPDKTVPPKGVVFKVPKAPRARSSRGARAGGSRLKMTAFVSAAVLIFAVSALYLATNWEAIVSGGALDRAAGATAAPLLDASAAPPPDLSEIRYYNGERLFAQERYREALVELRRVERDSRVVAEARRLILRIEDRLLRGPTETEQDTHAAR